jgi:ubiquinone/menaquinone biosynthesis C-methylase UbiE
MKNFDRKKHWENLYQTKKMDEVSWYQPIPKTSLRFVKQFNIPKDAKIIDVGGGDSYLVDHLLNLGYTDVTVLDISETALQRVKERLGVQASKVKWIVADAVNFESTEKYDLWHDRAAFHFLTQEQDIENYLETAHQSIAANGVMVIGAFSDKGPTKCSGIEIKQYTETSMSDRSKKFFEKINCMNIDHWTPSNEIQNYIFCGFRKRNPNE